MNLTEWFCDTKVEKISFVLTFFLLLFTFITSIFNEKISGYFLLSSFLVLIIYSMSSVYSSYRFFTNPLGDYLKSLFVALDDEQEIHNQLNLIEKQHLEQTKHRLSFELTRIDKRMGTLIGAVDKLGVFPAIIGFYITASKFFSDTQPGIVFYFMVGLATGVYFGCLPIISLINKLEKAKFIIESNLSSREQNSEHI